MTTFAKTGRNILNALAFANVGNLREFQQLLDQSPAPDVQASLNQKRIDLPESTGAATTVLCAPHD